MITFKQVSKKFSHGKSTIEVLEDIDFSLADGEFVTIFGPNGCGKTTLINIIGGLEKADGGTISIKDKNVKDIKVGYVFQNYNESLFPWRTALGNVEFALEIQGVSKPERLRKAEELLEKVGLLPHKNKYLYELSGGMKQLVAICRAIAYKPDILLMDEPFSSLDYSTTKKMEIELLKIWQEEKITTLFVSHDIDEAIFLADRVIVLSPRPSKIKKIFKIPLPRPRKLDMIASDEFFTIRNKILQSFMYE
jgi:NitT/TauT family transport system ATP-binding protein